MWHAFFGTGLIDPVDEMVGADNTVSHPEVLDTLAKDFVESGYDLKFLVRAITLSKAYGLSSVRSDASQDRAQAFARMPLRGLTAEQLFDSLVQATGFRDSGINPPPGAIIVGPRLSARAEFLGRFSNPSDKPTDTQTSILQALALMNGRLTAEATDLKRSETLAALLDAPFLDTAGRVEALYLSALGRRPTAKESARVAAFIEERTASGAGEKETRYQNAMADVFWALLNSAEFYLNH
jgi:hypothetical protein